MESFDELDFAIKIILPLNFSNDPHVSSNRMDDDAITTPSPSCCASRDLDISHLQLELNPATPFPQIQNVYDSSNATQLCFEQHL